MNKFFDVVLIGGGLAGLVSAGILASNGFAVCLLEKGTYPRNKVCGEFLSLESDPVLQKMGIFLQNLSSIKINQFSLSTISGSSASLTLPQSGIGISRYKLEEELYKRNLELGVCVVCNTKVVKIKKQNLKNCHLVVDQNGNDYLAKVVIGSFGKRSGMQLNRLKRSEYFAAKNYYKIPYQSNEVQLHIFSGGYAGMSMVETGLVNLCYLGKSSDLKKCGNIEAFQKQIVSQNPYLKILLEKGEPVLDKNLTISQIAFGNRSRVSGGMLHVGDAGGVIHPLSGNGMSMAIKSSELVAELVGKFLKNEISRNQLEKNYSQSWEKAFRKRMNSSRFYQSLFESAWGSKLAVGVLKNKLLGKQLIQLTHGKSLKFNSLNKSEFAL